MGYWGDVVRSLSESISVGFLASRYSMLSGVSYLTQIGFGSGFVW